MTKEISITIKNKLVMEKRDMTVYHHFSRSAHMISHNSSITIPLRPVMEDDYLHISIVSGPGNLGSRSVVNLPSWIDFEFSSKGDVTIDHSGERILLKVPPGLPTWQLKIKRSLSAFFDRPEDYVAIGDDQSEHQCTYPLAGRT